jgi:hypothetical protein
MAGRKKQQTIAKRNRERAVEEKRRLKRELKQAKREAARNGDALQPEPAEGPEDAGDPLEGGPPAVPSD